MTSAKNPSTKSTAFALGMFFMLAACRCPPPSPQRDGGVIEPSPYDGGKYDCRTFALCVAAGTAPVSCTEPAALTAVAPALTINADSIMSAARRDGGSAFTATTRVNGNQTIVSVYRPDPVVSPTPVWQQVIDIAGTAGPIVWLEDEPFMSIVDTGRRLVIVRLTDGASQTLELGFDHGIVHSTSDRASGFWIEEWGSQPYDIQKLALVSNIDGGWQISREISSPVTLPNIWLLSDLDDDGNPEILMDSTPPHIPHLFAFDSDGGFTVSAIPGLDAGAQDAASLIAYLSPAAGRLFMINFHNQDKLRAVEEFEYRPGEQYLVKTSSIEHLAPSGIFQAIDSVSPREQALLSFGSADLVSVVERQDDGGWSLTANHYFPSPRSASGLRDMTYGARLLATSSEQSSIALRAIAGADFGSLVGPRGVFTNGIPRAIAVDDVDRDGALDVVVGTASPNEIVIFWGGGNQPLSVVSRHSTALPVYSIAIAYDTSTGLTRILASPSDSATHVSMYFRGRTLERQNDLALAKSSYRLQFQNFVGSGPLELRAVHNASTLGAAIYDVVADGGFNLRAAVDAGVGASDAVLWSTAPDDLPLLATARFDATGDNLFVYGWSSDSKRLIRKGSAAVDAQFISLSNEQSCLGAASLLAADYKNNRVVRVSRDSSGALQTQTAFEASRVPIQVLSADLTGDSRDESIVIEDDSVEVAERNWQSCQNESPSTLRGEPNVAGGVLGDFDGDGDLDLVIIGSLYRAVRFMPNTCR